MVSEKNTYIKYLIKVIRESYLIDSSHNVLLRYICLYVMRVYLSTYGRSWLFETKHSMTVYDNIMFAHLLKSHDLLL